MGKFGDDIRKFREKSITTVSRVKRIVAIKLFNAVIMDTPVLTGRLRANWMLSLNEPDTNVSYALQDKSGQMMMGIIRQEVGKATYDDAIIMQNNLPYAYRIEYEGWSWQKSPAGMVRRNAKRFDALLRQAISEGKLPGGFTSTYTKG